MVMQIFTLDKHILVCCSKFLVTRIPSASMAAFRQLSTHGQKFDPESLYEPM